MLEQAPSKSGSYMKYCRLSGRSQKHVTVQIAGRLACVIRQDSAQKYRHE